MVDAGEKQHPRWSVDLAEFQSWADHAEAENTRLRAALTAAVECMEDYYRTPISARATLKDDIAKAKAALEGAER